MPTCWNVYHIPLDGPKRLLSLHPLRLVAEAEDEAEAHSAEIGDNGLVVVHPISTHTPSRDNYDDRAPPIRAFLNGRCVFQMDTNLVYKNARKPGHVFTHFVYKPERSDAEWQEVFNSVYKVL